jgi:hypothetical protein
MPDGARVLCLADALDGVELQVLQVESQPHLAMRAAAQGLDQDVLPVHDLQAHATALLLIPATPRRPRQLVPLHALANEMGDNPRDKALDIPRDKAPLPLLREQPPDSPGTESYV